MVESSRNEEVFDWVQFFHLEKLWLLDPEKKDEVCAAMFGLKLDAYREIINKYAKCAQQAAQELLSDPVFASRVDRLPFKPGQTVIGLGDSITDDLESWLEILRNLLELRRGKDNIKVLNAGVSADSTNHVISRFQNVTLEKPDWIICMIGTNDARRHGQNPQKILISPQETEKNFAMLRAFAQNQTSASWVWLTPSPVIEEKVTAYWGAPATRINYSNSDLAVIANIIRRNPEPVVDLWKVFGQPANPNLYLFDGLHPSLAGQKAIAKALVERLS
jgi:acyl-CoA thioesterase I